MRSMARKTKDKKFQMRMRPEDHRSLMQLADRDGVSMAQWIANHIRSEAKRRKLR